MKSIVRGKHPDANDYSDEFREAQRRARWPGRTAALLAGTALATASAATTAHPTARHHHHHDHGKIRHVLLISVDGLHQQDLAWFVRNFPNSALAHLARHGTDYARAMTPFPSDSFPGMVGQVTGGDPGVTGIYLPAWTAAHPGAGDLVVFSTDDDGMLLWLSDRSQQAADFVKNYLLTHSAAANNISDSPITVTRSGLKAVFAGAASARLFGVPVSDPRHPDIVGIAQHGVVYTGGTAKIAEHGGDDPQDRNVPILLVVPGQRFGGVNGDPVETTQIAPTILKLLHLNPNALQAVRIEHTRVLPDLDR
jgi:hypothetical protein